MKTYGDLFDYLDRRLERCDCDNQLTHTTRFAEENGLFFGELAQRLEDMGGYCDCEVLMNAAADINPEQVIGEETFVTPRQYAIEHGLYCHSRVDGIPVSFGDAVAAKHAGRTVEWHHPCGKDDPFASTDLNRASLALRGGRVK